ncbi:MAG TPA: hypothetical protein VFS02_07535 [Telluria sp.]|nr:hypothetical protein [Telluria sp.]
MFAQIRNPVIANETTIYGNQIKVLQSADIVFPDGTTPQYVGNSEGFYREGANAISSFLDLDAKYRVNNDLTFKGLFSTRRGVGTTVLDQGLTFARYGTGISYGLNGISDAPNSQYIGAGTNTPGLNPDGSGYQLVGFGASGIKTVDRESSLQFDSEYKLDKGFLQSIESGVRYSDHRRNSAKYQPAFHSATLAAAPADGVVPYSSDFGNGLGGGNWDNTGFSYQPDVLKAYIAGALKPTTAEFERVVASEIDMRERQSAIYLMANMDADKWSGNVACVMCAPRSMRRSPRRSRQENASSPSRARRPCRARRIRPPSPLPATARRTTTTWRSTRTAASCITRRRPTAASTTCCRA